MQDAPWVYPQYFKRIAHYLTLSVAEKRVSHTQHSYKNQIHCFQQGFFHAHLHLDQHLSKL